MFWANSASTLWCSPQISVECCKQILLLASKGIMNNSSTHAEGVFICPLCNIDNRAGAKFCRRCGTARAEIEAVMPRPELQHREVEPTELKSRKLQQTPVVTALPAKQDLSPVSFPAAYVQPLCVSCDTLLRASDRFCCWCGDAQPLRMQPPVKSCPQCTQNLPVRANYCFDCGKQVSGGRLQTRIPSELFKEESSEFFPTYDA